MGGNPFAVTIRHIIQGEVGVRCWIHETEVQREVKIVETDLLINTCMVLKARNEITMQDLVSIEEKRA